VSIRYVAIAIAVLALIAVPYAINQPYYVNIASQILLYAVFALGLNILVGYGGLVSLGHAGLSGAAAYAVAYLLAAGHGHIVAIAGGLAAGLLVTAGFAALALRATGISFIMITLALGEIIWGLAYRWISITNGDNGISVSSRPAPFGLSLNSANAFYDAALIIFLLAVAACAIFVRSPFGAALTGTRDQPRRMTALGFHVWMIRFWAFMFSGLLSSISGILFVYYYEFVSPPALALPSSAEVLLMVISGGAGTLLGPVVGAALVVIVKLVVSGLRFTVLAPSDFVSIVKFILNGLFQHWNFLLGAIFVLIVVFMPEGLVPGTVRLARAAWREAERRNLLARAAATFTGQKP
jgi:branched-chain amino acid transport system permease protein